jgi:hypothetical protein
MAKLRQKALPHAAQVADRWHLMKNTGRAFLDAVRKSMRQIRSAIGATAIDPKLLTAAERLQYEGYLLPAASLSLTRDPGAFCCRPPQVAPVQGLRFDSGPHQPGRIEAKPCGRCGLDPSGMARRGLPCAARHELRTSARALGNKRARQLCISGGCGQA